MYTGIFIAFHAFHSADSIQKIIQFNTLAIIDTGRIGKVPKNCPKSVQNRQKRRLFIKNGKNQLKILLIHSFHNEIQSKGLINIIFFRNIQLKNTITLFHGKFNSKIDSKIQIWLYSIQNIHSITKPGY